MKSRLVIVLVFNNLRVHYCFCNNIQFPQYWALNHSQTFQKFLFLSLTRSVFDVRQNYPIIGEKRGQLANQMVWNKAASTGCSLCCSVTLGKHEWSYQIPIYSMNAFHWNRFCWIFTLEKLWLTTINLFLASSDLQFIQFFISCWMFIILLKLH